jgi:hypothetical protein
LTKVAIWQAEPVIEALRISEEQVGGFVNDEIEIFGMGMMKKSRTFQFFS